PNSLEYQCSESITVHAPRRVRRKSIALTLTHDATHPRVGRKPPPLCDFARVARTGILSSTPAPRPLPHEKDPTAGQDCLQDENHQHFCQVFSGFFREGGGRRPGGWCRRGG